MSSLPPLPTDVDSQAELIHFVDRHQAGRYLTLAVFVFLIWDHFVTFDDEVKHIWKTKPLFTIAKGLFFVNRYFSPAICLVRVLGILAPSKLMCNGGLTFTSYGAIVNIVCVETTLMLRVWALYAKSRIMAAFLAIIFIAGVAASIVVVRFLAVTGSSTPHNFDFVAKEAPKSVTTCSRSPASEYFFLFLIEAVVECIMFILTVHKAWSRSMGEKTPIITALLKHGTIYFGAVFFCMLLTILSLMHDFLAQPFMDSNFPVAITSAACSRLILSLRGLYSREADLGTNKPTSINPGTSVEWARSNQTGQDTMVMGDVKSKVSAQSSSFQKRTQRSSVTYGADQYDAEWDAPRRQYNEKEGFAPFSRANALEVGSQEELPADVGITFNRRVSQESVDVDWSSRSIEASQTGRAF